MRGDSRRDLYAKSLALCGLAVLAGVGALVDYWPARVVLPAASSVLEPASPLLAVSSDRAIVARPLDREGVVSVPAAMTAAPAPKPRVASFALASGPTMFAASTGIGLTSLPPAAPAAGIATLEAPAVVADTPAAAVPLSEPAEVPFLSARYLAPVQTATPDELDRGFFSGSIDFAKRAGSTVMATGSKAGASIMDGLGFAGRMFKKLKIF